MRNSTGTTTGDSVYKAYCDNCSAEMEDSLDNHITLTYGNNVPKELNLCKSCMEKFKKDVDAFFKGVSMAKPKIKKCKSEEEYNMERCKLALSYCPTIYPCIHCGYPVVDGYCCEYCDSASPGIRSQ